MEFIEVIAGRRMIRCFDPSVEVGAEELKTIIACGLSAPSAGYTQGVELLVLQGAEVDTFWRLSSDPDRPPSGWLRGMQTAPVLILVWTSEAAYRRRYGEADKRGSGGFAAPYWWVDAGMCVDQLLLAAVDAELASCFFGVPPARQETVAQAFGVPVEQSSVGVVALGHRDGASLGARGSARRVKRGQERVHRGAWSAPGRAVVPRGVETVAADGAVTSRVRKTRCRPN